MIAMQEGADSKLSEQTNELNKLIDLFMDSTPPPQTRIKEALASLFDLLLWAEKRNPALLKAALDVQILALIVEKYPLLVLHVIGGFTLLLGNAKEGGELVGYILERRLGDRIIKEYGLFLKNLQDFDEEEHLHVVASFLKAYHRHFTESTYRLFIQNGQCLLINICCKFFNCSQEITRTSIMNILMTLLGLPFISEVLAHKEIGKVVEVWCRNMCRLFRNELKDFDQQLLITEEEESEFIVHSINDKIFLWEDLSALKSNIFAVPFYEEIVLPLVIGSLNTNGIPLFTLKFALFILNKLVKTIASLGLLNRIGSLLFKQQDVTFNDNQLGTAILKPFHLKQLLQLLKSDEEELQQDRNTFKGINLFFMNILRSKDGRFLECICVLVINIMMHVKRLPESLPHFIKELGFGINGFMSITISDILITQFNAMHSIEIIKVICSLLVFIQPTKYLIDDVKNRFIYMYEAVLNDTIKILERSKDVHPAIAEIFEYDVRIVCSQAYNFNLQAKSDSALLFNNQIIENQMLPFYHQLPETNDNLLRYHLVKALILRRLGVKLLEECQEENSLERYVQRLRVSEAKYIKPGEYLKLPIQCNSYRCKLVDGKIEIPSCLLLEDDENLIVGYFENMQIKIIMNIKMKHVQVSLRAKKDKSYLEFDVRRFQNKSQSIQKVNGFLLKNIDIGIEHFKVKKERVLGKQLSTIFDILKRALKCIPEVSLI